MLNTISHDQQVWVGSQLHKKIVVARDKPKSVFQKTVISNKCDEMRSLKIQHSNYWDLNNVTELPDMRPGLLLDAWP